ncbi:MAG TPA: hypothetical protein DDX92_03150 [Flavobacteriales bacterium]|jgi:hypothetical protein|nr:hypothetical protein [Flavobacteriales bacterium]
MKYTIIFILSLFLYSLMANGQEDTIPDVPDIPFQIQRDTSNNQTETIIRIKRGKVNYRDCDSDVTISLFETNRNRVWQAFEFGFVGVEQPDLNGDDPDRNNFDVNTANSINWAINPIELDVRIINEYVKFSTGFGYQAKNFSLRDNRELYKEDGITFVRQNDEVSLRKTRFRTGYITIPAMLYFNTSKNASKAFRIGGGVVGGIRIFQTYRWKYFADDNKSKGNSNGGWNANPFMADARGVVGIGPINLYATYSLLPLFEENRGPEVYPYTFGISFVNIW